ncbi:metal ABC transporter ATP-binding protein [Kalamiella sp. sgz302252]|uniref:metal ABC transporter ATP-binding protein n=1 Tax=Pantoea sp. sgz302252 TaxID=3341827 RepID=UPI0036D43018
MIKLENLRVGYQGRAVTPPLNGVFAQGSMTALVGANGCGKSTLLKTIVGLLPPVSGLVELAPPQLNVGWLPQQAEIEKSFPISVFDLVALGCWRHCGWFGAIDRQGRQKVMAALEQVNMAEFAAAQPGTLSGGQLQRVLFARLLVQEASLLLLDEPFTGIDAETTRLLLTLLMDLHQKGHTLIVVLHDQAIVEHYFPQVLRLEGEKAEWLQTLPVVTRLESA